MLKTILLTWVSLSLVACACPRTDVYSKTPYDSDRTAGSGTAVYKGSCEVEVTAPQQQPVATKPEKIFQKKQIK